jgi:hypothetical protein
MGQSRLQEAHTSDFVSDKAQKEDPCGKSILTIKGFHFQPQNFGHVS